MPLYLVAPGRRKGNRFFIIRGKINGLSVEWSTKTTDEPAAVKFKAELELKILENRVPSAGEEMSFARAVDLYRAYRDPAKADVKRLDRLVAQIGGSMIRDITHANLVEMANRLYGGRSAATRNREALRPAASVLHYCAGAGFCPWLRVPLFKETRPRTRAVDVTVASAIVAAISGEPAPAKDGRAYGPWARERRAAAHAKKRLLLLWLFRQGNRISDVLKIRWEAIDLRARTVTYHVGKTDRPDVVKPLHDEVWELLASNPQDAGRLFPWHTRSGVYAWLRPAMKKLGITFTPHMARHSLGKWLNEDGASLRLIMDALDHADPESSIRYQSTDVEVIRRAGQRLGNLVGKSSK